MPTGEYKRRREEILARERRNREEGRLPYWRDRARSINWKAARRNITGTVTGEQLMELYQSEKRCLYCGEELLPKTAQFDHVIPLSKEGANTIENMCVACGPCNLDKNDDTAEQFVNRVEATGEPEEAYAWILDHKQEIRDRIDTAQRNGIREADFDFSDYI